MHRVWFIVSMALWLGGSAAGIWAFVGPQTIGKREYLSVNTRETELRTLSVVIEAYATAHGEYPRAASCADLARYLVPEVARTISCESSFGNAVRYSYYESTNCDPTLEDCQAATWIPSQGVLVSVASDAGPQPATLRLLNANKRSAEALEVAVAQIRKESYGTWWRDYLTRDIVMLNEEFVNGIYPDSTRFTTIVHPARKKRFLLLWGGTAIALGILGELARRRAVALRR